MKDNSAVGSISAINGDLTIQSTTSGHEGLRFGNGAIVPVGNTGASTNNECNLGGATGRFADLFLANSLDLSKSTNQAQVNIRSTVTPNGSKIGGQINLSLGSGSNSGSGNTSTQVGDTLGQVLFNGQGTDFAFQGGSIEVKQTTPNGQTNRTNAGCDMIFSVIPAGNTGYTEKLRIKSTGGITFNGDTSVNNALDDYEEGTWTPVLTTSGNTDYSSVGYSIQYGHYTKVGRMVTAQCRVQTNSFTQGSPSGNIRISGLPFTSATNNIFDYSGSIGFTSKVDFNLSSFGTLDTGAVVNRGTSVISLTRTRSNNTADGVPATAITASGFDTSITVSYIV